MWPGERRVQAELPGRWAVGSEGAEPGADAGGAFERTCRRLTLAAWGLALLLVVGVVIMVGKP